MKLSHIKWFLAILVVSSVLARPAVVQAGIFISEVMANPLTGPEWVELINTGDQSVDLSGFHLEDALTTPTTILTFADQEQLTNQQIKVFDLPTTKLNNSGDGVSLKNAAGEVVDQLNFGNSPAGESWQRLSFDGLVLTLGSPSPGTANWTTEPTIWLTPTAIPTATSPTLSPTTIPTVNLATPSAGLTPTVSVVTIPVDAIQFSEVVACADNHGEWVELSNQLAQSVDLTGWLVIDSSGNKRSFDSIIAGSGLATLAWQENMLNNSGDSIILIDTKGQTQDSLNLPACQSGDSYAKINQVWQVSHQPSFNTKNVESSVNPSLTATPTLTLTSSHTSLQNQTLITSVTTKPTAFPTDTGRFSLPLAYLSQLQLNNATPSGRPTLIDHNTNSDPLSPMTQPRQTTNFFLWSGIMGSLFLITGGLLLTHVSFPLAFPSSRYAFH